jgi:hypothetical protein
MASMDRHAKIEKINAEIARMEVEYELECGHGNGLQVDWKSYIPFSKGSVVVVAVDHVDAVNAGGKFNTNILQPAILSFSPKVAGLAEVAISSLSTRIEFDRTRLPMVAWLCTYDASEITGAVPYPTSKSCSFDVAVLLFLTKTHMSYCVLKLNEVGGLHTPIPKKISEEIRYNDGREKTNYAIQLGTFKVVWEESMKRA